MYDLDGNFWSLVEGAAANEIDCATSSTPDSLTGTTDLIWMVLESQQIKYVNIQTGQAQEVGQNALDVFAQGSNTYALFTEQVYKE